jgi:hypothetical protein
VQALYNEYHAGGFEPLAINLGEGLATVKLYARQYSFTFLRDQSYTAWNLYNISGYIPLNYVIDTAQIVVGGEAQFNEAHIRSWVTPYLGVEDIPVPAVQITGVVPSPANRPVTVRYSADKPGRAALRIYSCTGELVRTMPGGSGSITWDLRDASGRRVPNGLYVCEVTTQAGSARTAVSVVR